jgi:8-oxo-dGTP pyrophosphatase MutT (NUDIX family)
MSKKQPDSVYGLYINDRHRVLLIKDSSSMLWGFPGGSVESNETHILALQREFIEETNLMIETDPVYLTQWTSPTKDRYVYKVKGVTGSLSLSGNGSDTVAAIFFDVRELADLELADGVSVTVYSQL